MVGGGGSVSTQRIFEVEVLDVEVDVFRISVETSAELAKARQVCSDELAAAMTVLLRVA